MENLRDRLITAIQDYGSERIMNFDAEDVAQYIGKEATITYHEHEEDCASAYLLDIDDSFWSWNEKMLEDVQ